MTREDRVEYAEMLSIGAVAHVSVTAEFERSRRTDGAYDAIVASRKAPRSHRSGSARRVIGAVV